MIEGDSCGTRRVTTAAGSGRWESAHMERIVDSSTSEKLARRGALAVVNEDVKCLMLVRRGQCTRRNCPFGHDLDAAAAEDQQPNPPAANTTQTADKKHRGRTQFVVLHADKAPRRRGPRFAPGQSDWRPGEKMLKDLSEDDSDCEDY